MKINEKNLCAFASSATPVDREGWLEMRAEVGKNYQRRWFTLKGNLLFYFDKNTDREPVGVVILEGCTIGMLQVYNKYNFVLLRLKDLFYINHMLWGIFMEIPH